MIRISTHMVAIRPALLYELRHAARALARRPAFSLVAIALFALGIGANVALFGVAQTLFLRPLPVADSDRLVGVYESRDGRGYYPMSYANYVDYREAGRAFEELAAHYSTAPLQVEAAETSGMLNGSVVSDNYFSMLGLEPAVGRLIGPADFSAGAPRAAVLGYEIWQQWFDGRREALGAIITVNRVPFTVVGVAPERFRGVLVGNSNAIWLPLSRADVGYRFCDPFSRDCSYLNLLGKLGPGRSLTEARSELEQIASHLRAAYPRANANAGVAVAPARGMRPDSAAYHAGTARILTWIVGAVLLIACANFASLLLVRTWSRGSEIAIRQALGAGRGRIAILLLAESLLLALTGGALALWLGWALHVGLEPFFSLDPGWHTPPISARVIVFTLILSIVAAVASSLFPIFAFGRSNVVAGLKNARHGGAARGRAALVALQLAVSLALLIGTEQLVRSLIYLGSGSAFPTRQLVSLRLRPRLAGYDRERTQQTLAAAITRLRSLPGVEAVSYASGLPGAPWGSPVSVRQLPSSPDGSSLDVHFDWVEAEYFATIGLPILAGRGFRADDGPEAPPVVVLGATLARTLWPTGTAVGREVAADDEIARVVGVVPDPYPQRPGQTPPFVLYRPFPQSSRIDARVVARVSGDPRSALEPLRSAIAAVDSELPVSEVSTLDARRAEGFRPVRLAGLLVAASGIVGLLLASIGLYGVLAFGVTRRTREIGIRMALGARMWDVLMHVVGDGLRLGVLGLLLGIPLALALSKSLAGVLYGVRASSPLGWAMVTLTLAAAVVVAAWVPARRASKIEPASALRVE